MKRNFNGFLLLIFWLSWTVAASQTPVTDTRRKAAAPSFRLGNRQRSLPKLPPSEMKKRLQRLRAVAPLKPLKGLSPLTAKEKALEKSLDEEINELHRLIRKYKKHLKRAELYLRQAELFREKSRIIVDRLQKVHEIRFERWLKADRVGPEPKLNTAEAQRYNRKAIELYRWFLEDFKQDRRVPMAMFFLGYNYFEAGVSAPGKAVLNEVVKKYPQSDFAGLANFHLAEQYFEERNWTEAQSYYQRELTDEKKENYLFALYKYAWCQFYLSEPGKALTNMKIVFQRSLRRTQKEAENRFSQKLWEEAKRALVFFYAEGGDYRRAYNELRSLAEGDGREELVAQLADLYSDRGEVAKASYIYQQILRDSPMAKRAPYYAYEVIAQYDAWDKPDEYHRRLLHWLGSYSENSRWAGRHPQDGETARAFQEEKLRAWVLHNHRSLQNKSPGASKERTLQAYQSYLKNFSTQPKAPEMRYFYGDLLFAIGEYSQAAEQYLHLADKEPKSVRMKEVRLGAVLSLEKTLPSDEEIQRGIGQSSARVPLPANVALFVKAADDFVARYPQERDVLEIRYRTSRIYYLYNHFTEAETKFLQIIDLHPESVFAEYSANLLLDIYNLKKDYEGFVRVGNRLAGQSAFRRTKLAQDIDQMVEQAAFKQAADGQKTAPAFLEFARKYPRSPLAGDAYFNAAVILRGENDISGAIEQFHHAATVKKNGEVTVQAHRALAGLYEQIGKYLRAAEEYGWLAKQPDVTREEKGDFLYNAGVLWTALGESARAEASFKPLLAEYPDRRKQVLLLMAETYCERRDYQKSNTYYYTLINEFRAEPERCAWSKEAAENEKKAGKGAAARYLLKETEKCLAQSSSSRGRLVALEAELEFHRAVELYSRIIEFRRSATPAQREKALVEKLKLLEDLEKKLTDIVGMNVTEYIVSSLAVGGEVYRFMADLIASSPAPAGLSEPELKQYQEGVAQYAEKMNDHSLRYVRLARQKAVDLRWTTEWLDRVAASTSLFKTNRARLEIVDEY